MVSGGYNNLHKQLRSTEIKRVDDDSSWASGPHTSTDNFKGIFVNYRDELYRFPGKNSNGIVERFTPTEWIPTTQNYRYPIDYLNGIFLSDTVVDLICN